MAVLLKMFYGPPIQKGRLCEAKGRTTILVTTNDVVAMVGMVLKYTLIRG